MKEFLIREASRYLKAKYQNKKYNVRKIVDGILECSLYPSSETGILRKSGILPNSDKVFLSKSGIRLLRFIKFNEKVLAFYVNENEIFEIYLVNDNKLDTIIEKIDREEQLNEISLYPPHPVSFQETILDKHEEYDEYNDIEWLKWNKEKFEYVLSEFLSLFNLKFDDFKKIIEEYDHPNFNYYRSDSFLEYRLLSDMGDEITKKFLNSINGVDIGFGIEILIPDRIQIPSDIDLIKLPILNKEIIDFWESFIVIDYIDNQITIYPEGRKYFAPSDVYPNNKKKFLVTWLKFSINTQKKYAYISISKGDDINQEFYISYNTIDDVRNILKKYNVMYKGRYWDSSYYYTESYYYISKSIYDTQMYKLVKELKNHEISNPHKTYKCCNGWEIIICD